MFWRRKKREHDLDREIHAHLAAESEEQQENGLTPDEARYAAQRTLGNPTLIKEDTRATWGLTWLERLKQDLAYAARTFRRTPGFTAVAILTLALGIGATTAIFSVVNAVFLHPLPYPNADRLVVIWEKLLRDPKGPPVFDTYRDFEAWKNHSQSFEILAPATWKDGGRIVTGRGPARDVLALPVGIDYFSLLGAKPEIGRTFQHDDLRSGCTVVLKHSFWTTVLGGQKSVVGAHIQLNETACTVIGVMPPGFTFYPDAIAMWMLITPASEIARDPEHAAVGAFGLLKPGVSIAQAQKEVELLYVNEHRKDPHGIQVRPVVFPLAEEFSYLTGPNLRLSVIVLFGAVGFVLLIACLNIANLLLGRALVRQKELAVRAALGSGRARLIRQLLTEGLLLSIAGAVLGTVLAAAAVHYFRVLNPIDMPPGNPVSVNLWVLAFSAVLAVVTALVFGLTPALKASRVDLFEALKAGSRSASFAPEARAIGKALVAAEVMLSFVLLAGAGLLIQSVDRLASVPLGFRPEHLWTMSIGLPKWSYSKPDRRAGFYARVIDRARAFPGVESAAFASSLPLSGGRWGGNVLVVEGRPEPQPTAVPGDIAKLSITRGYFQTMDVPLERGRLFEDRDREGSQAVAIVNESLVRTYFPNESPIGRQIKVGEPGAERPWLTIVGVVADEKDKNFFHEMAWEDVPVVFRPVSQDPPSNAALVLRVPRDEIDLGAAMQKEIANIDSSVPVGDIQTMNSRLSHTLSYPRFRAIVLGAFAGLALLLAGVGLYGVLSQSIVQRTQEFGIRMALGAQKGDVLRLVVRQGLVLTGTGLILGIAAALYLTRSLSSLLYSVKAADAWTLACVSPVLLLVAFLATYIPAHRAMKVDPMVALRYE